VHVSENRRFIELSHVIREGMITYPGLPAPTIDPFLTRADSKARYAPGTEFAMDMLTLIGNTGTYLDSPWHRYEGGTDLAGLTLETLVDLPTEVFRLGGGRAIEPALFAGRELTGKAVLLDTGWSKHFASPAYQFGAPYLTSEGVDFLVDAGVVLVGIDSLNIDNTEGTGERPAHTNLLAAGIHVVEHLTNLDALPDSGARFTAAPPLIAEFGTFPVRAFATIHDAS
jgi:arylformamidase